MLNKVSSQKQRSEATAEGAQRASSSPSPTYHTAKASTSKSATPHSLFPPSPSSSPHAEAPHEDTPLLSVYLHFSSQSENDVYFLRIMSTTAGHLRAAELRRVQQVLVTDAALRARLRPASMRTKGNKGHRLALQWCPDLRKVQIHDVMAVGADFTSPLEASFLDILEYGVISANDLGGGESGESAQDLTQNQDQFPETPRALQPPPGFPSTSRKQQHLEQYRHIEEHEEEEVDNETVTLLAWTRQHTEPPLNTFSIGPYAGDNALGAEPCSELLAFIIIGNEQDAQEMVNLVNATPAFRSHLPDTGELKTRIIREPRQQEALRRSAARHQLTVLAADADLPPMIGSVSLKCIVDKARPLADILEFSIRDVAKAQTHLARQPANGNIFQDLGSLLSYNSPGAPSQHTFKRNMVVEVAEHLAPPQNGLACARCSIITSTRSGPVEVAGRDLTSEAESQTTRHLAVSLCHSCLRGHMSVETFAAPSSLMRSSRTGSFHTADQQAEEASLWSTPNRRPGLLFPVATDPQDEDRWRRPTKAERAELFFQEHGVADVESLDPQFFPEYTLRVECNSDQSTHYKTRYAVRSQLKYGIEKMSIWDNTATMTQAHRALFQTEDKAFATRFMDALAFQTYRTELALLLHDLQKANPLLLVWIPVAEVLESVFIHVVRRRTVLVKVQELRRVHHAVHLAGRDMQSTAPIEDLTLYKDPETHFKVLLDTLSLTTFAKEMPKLLYGIAYHGEHPDAFLRVFSDVFMVLGATQVLQEGSRVSYGPHTFVVHLLRAVEKNYEDLHEKIERYMYHEHKIRVDDLVDDASAKAAQQLLTEAVRLKLEKNYRPSAVKSSRSTIFAINLDEDAESSDDEKVAYTQKDSARASSSRTERSGVPPTGFGLGSDAVPWRDTSPRQRDRKYRRPKASRPPGDRRVHFGALPLPRVPASSRTPPQPPPDSSGKPPIKSFFAVQGKQLRRKRNECFNCGSSGHWARECPEDSRFKDSSRQPHKPLLFLHQLAADELPLNEVSLVVATQGFPTKGLEPYTVAQLDGYGAQLVASLCDLESIKLTDMTHSGTDTEASEAAESDFNDGESVESDTSQSS